MGRRSRQRSAEQQSKQQLTAKQEAAVKRITGGTPAPWGSFPLTELAVLLALISLVIGFVVGGKTGIKIMSVGLILGSLAGLELVLRQHLAGDRSYAPTLAGLVAMIATTVAFAAGLSRPLMLAVGIGIFIVAYGYLKHLFEVRSERKSSS